MITVDPKNPRGIVWLASFPRSGNTWMRLFINRLFEIIALDPVPPPDMNRPSRIEVTENDAALYVEFLGKPVSAATRKEIADARPKVQAAILSRAAGLVFAKTHNANLVYLGAPLIRHDLSAGGVYLVRNPLDVAISFASFLNTSIDESIRMMATPGLGTASIGGRVYTQSGSWNENVESWTTPAHPAVLIVRYEDMVDAPVATFAASARHVGFAASPEQIQRAINETSFQRLDTSEREAGFRELPEGTRKFFREGKSGQWRATLTKAQVGAGVGNHRALMVRFGYLTPEVLAAM
jgi:hypothetical protein